jgi:formyltetrahydrofolate deformylase
MAFNTKLNNAYTLRVSCPAVTGIVAAISGFLADRKFYISEMSQYDSEDSQRFFARIVFQAGTEPPHNDSEVLKGFEVVAKDFDIQWAVRRTDRARRVLLMVSKFDHCLRDLLYRWEVGELNIDPVAIVSNHETLRYIAERYNVPFYCLPVTVDTKAQQENALRALIKEANAEVIVLARYMQILSDSIARELHGNCINIHHSFLPSFKGGSPYAQAFARGVKLIGATAHFVTGDLDEGPIIEQDVHRIDHRFSAGEMQAIGRDVECRVLARALRAHVEDRVFLDGSKAIVFA